MSNLILSEALSREMLGNGKGKKLDTSLIIAGSYSDFGKMKELFIDLNKKEIAYWLTALSAHRSPEELGKVIHSLPGIYIPEGISTEVSNEIIKANLNIKVILATAGLSAHLAGVIASKTLIPVIALPGESSTSGVTDSTPSMINMPPGIPNGFVANQKIASLMLQNIMELKQEDCKILYIEKSLIDDPSKELLELFGINYSTDPSNAIVGIQEYNLIEETSFKPNTKIPVIIPTGYSKIDSDSVGYFLNSLENLEGLTMGYNLDSKVNTKNAIIYAAQLFGIYNPEILSKLKKYRAESESQVVDKNNELILAQLKSCLK